MHKIGILGGTFDPIHNGHIEIAKSAKNYLGLDKIWLMPNSISPFKVGKKTASATDRVKMCELAIKGLDGFEVSTLEVFKEDVSYTFDTLNALVNKNKETTFYFIIGADQASSLDKWYKIDELLKIVKFVVFQRTGYHIPNIDELIVIDDKAFDVSSTTEKESGFKLVNEEVKKYIMENKLYGK